MRRGFTFVAILLVCVTSMASQNVPAPTNSERKVTARVPANYPELAKRARMHGVVKLEVIVRPNGTVKSMRVIGGNPVFIDAATDAVSRWRFEPAQTETTEVVKLTFVPES